MPYSHLSGAVVTDSGSLEHQQAMLEQPVAVRDGDDLIATVEAQPELDIKPTQEEGDKVTRIELNTEDGEVVTEEGQGDTQSESTDGEEFIPSDDVSQAADTAGAEMASALAGQNELLAQAVERGLDPAVIEQMTAEFDGEGAISEASYKALAEAGYSKAFVDSYIAGQNAVATRFAESIVAYAGGAERFEALKDFMVTNSPAQVQAFNDAVERNDVATIKALLDSGKVLMGKSHGNAPKRNLTAAAKPKAVTVGKEPEGFESQAAMIKAMSDKRYGRDSAYTREVELKVFKSKF